MRAVVLLVLWLLRPRKEILGKPPTSPLTPEKVAFIEAKTREYFQYVLESYDVAKKEGNNVLQWLFGATIGGIGLTGSLGKNSYWCLAAGAFVASCWAAYAASRLIRCLRSQHLNPPGNSAESLNAIIEDSEHRIRWRETKGTDTRNAENIQRVEKVATGVDQAREALTFIPYWFLGTAACAAAFKIAIIKMPCLQPVRELLKAASALL